MQDLTTPLHCKITDTKHWQPRNLKCHKVNDTRKLSSKHFSSVEKEKGHEQKARVKTLFLTFCEEKCLMCKLLQNTSPFGNKTTWVLPVLCKNFMSWGPAKNPFFCEWWSSSRYAWRSYKDLNHTKNQLDCLSIELSCIMGEYHC